MSATAPPSGALQGPRGDWICRWSVRFVAALSVLAVAAPLIASGRPYLLYVPEGAERPGAFGALPVGWSSPWLLGLLDRREFVSPVDRAFNALLLIAPFALVAWLVWARRRRPLSRRSRVFLAGAAVACAALAGTLLSTEGPSPRYADRVEALRSRGHDVVAWFAPVERGPRDASAEHSLEGPSDAFLLGTDRSGRDVFVRLLYGTRISLTIGVVAVSIYLVIGILLGALAGYFRGWVDALILRLVEVVACFPSLLLILLLIAVIETRSIFHVMVVIGLTEWPTVARLVRAELLRQAEMDYARAARAAGLGPARIVFRHLLPNALAPVWVTAAFGVAGAILIESALAFLNLGDPTVPSWGQVLRVGQETGKLHLILAPGLLIFVTVTAMNLAAEGLRDALDPHLEPR